MTHLRDLHPGMERRLELWRYQEFELTREESHEHLVVFRGRARTNAADERIFVIGEVASHLLHPLAVGSWSNTSDIDPTSLKIDDEKHQITD